MTIRPAVAADLDAMLALARACFGLSAWTRDHFLPRVGITPERDAFVADLPAQACAGYIVLEYGLDDAELQSLAVREECRCRGIGDALLAAGVAATLRQGAARILLEVRAGNAAAQRFYLQRGFAECGRRPHYYHHPDEEAVLMRRLLAPAHPYPSAR